MSQKTFADLVALMEKLRSPDGCPWDREQKLSDLKPFIIEEAYEVVDAIDQNDPGSLKEEVGDLLFEAVFVARIAEEEGSFTVDDAIQAVHDKLVRRHPHVFAQVKADTSDQVLVNSEKLKSAERREENKGILSGVPRALPALLKAGRLTEKAARVGFDWEQVDDITAKLEEETRELRDAMSAGDPAEIQAELGDLLFTIANIARRLGVNAEEALQRANGKFTRRFESIEQALRDSSRTFDEVDLAEMDRLWDQAKAKGL